MHDVTRFVTARFMAGDAYFIGLFVSCVAMPLAFSAPKAWLRSLATVVAVTGVILVVLSAAPIPYALYAVWLAVLVVAWVLMRRQKRVWLWSGLVGIASLAMAVWELPHHLPVTVRTAGFDTLFVVGDSLSMGADPPGKNWPELLGEMAKLAVKNYSFGGAKVRTALHNAERIDKDRCLVILEIGGNDLLGGSADFASDLDRMLRTVCNGKREVAMLELPLPPCFNRYGMAQRKLARKYGVTLIPKRYLTAVLVSPGATLDGLHLSNKGHKQLAETLFGMMKTGSE